MLHEEPLDGEELENLVTQSDLDELLPQRQTNSFIEDIMRTIKRQTAVNKICKHSLKIQATNDLLGDIIYDPLKTIVERDKITVKFEYRPVVPLTTIDLKLDFKVS